MPSPLDVALAYIRAVEAGATGERLKEHLSDDFVLQEWPHLLAPQGTVHGLAGVLRGAEQGREVVAEQRFDVRRSTVQGPRVVLEIDWSGTLRIPVLDWPVGHRLRARTAVVLEVEADRIKSQQSYDCYYQDLPEALHDADAPGEVEDEPTSMAMGNLWPPSAEPDEDYDARAAGSSAGSSVGEGSSVDAGSSVGEGDGGEIPEPLEAAPGSAGGAEDELEEALHQQVEGEHGHEHRTR